MRNRFNQALIGGIIIMYKVENKRFESRFNINDFIIAIISCVFVIGILFPTSIQGIINRKLNMILALVIVVFFTTIIVLSRKINKKFIFYLFLINIVLWSATLLNFGSKIEKSTAIYYLLITIIFCFELREIKISKKQLKYLNFINIILLTFGLGIIMQNSWVTSFIISHYSDFYDGLVINMMDRGKPVVFFGSHSIAGFYMFIFFVFNYLLFKKDNNKIYLIISLIYLYFCFALKSNTSIFLFILGVLFLIKDFKYNKLALVLFIVVTILTIFNPIIHNSFNDIRNQILLILNSNQNGFLGRYSGGNQIENILYIINHPFKAIGFSNNIQDLVLFDSGLVVNTLRGTIFLAITIYTAFYKFMIYNIKNKKIAIISFLTYFIFEIGFNNLCYPRTIATLPFFVILTNYIYEEK